MALMILISSKAKETARKNGQNVLFRKGNILICRKPDGKEMILKELPPRDLNLPAEYVLS
ncbi:hypothetical protein FH593_15355 [Leptospira interrogans]|nr:hypothetical protein [Leptospira interrogans]ULG90254.1 hypothetical protein FH593_15355 [Leptospira interrogans]